MTDPIPMTKSYEDIKRDRPMRWWYESLADHMLASPQATQGEIAAHFGKTDSTISLIINSDAFKAYYRQRRQDVAEKLNEAVRAKLFKVADTSLDHLLTSLEKKRDTVPIEMLHRTTDMALRNLGYGAERSASGGVATVATVVNVAVSVADLEAAREALRRNQLSQPPSPPTTLIDAGDAFDEGPALGRGGDHSGPCDEAPLAGGGDPQAGEPEFAFEPAPPGRAEGE